MKSLILALAVITMFGCSKKENPSSQYDITAQEIAAALQMYKLTIKSPEDCSVDDSLVLKMILEDEERIIASIKTSPGEVTRLFIWWQGSEPIPRNFHWVQEDGWGIRGKFEHPAFSFGMQSAPITDKTYGVGDVILSGEQTLTDGKKYQVKLCLETK